MLNDARSHLFDAPHLVIFPAVTVMLAVLAFNFIGVRFVIIWIRDRELKSAYKLLTSRVPWEFTQPQ